MDAETAKRAIKDYIEYYEHRWGKKWTQPHKDEIICGEWNGNERVEYTYNYLIGIIKTEELLNELDIPTSN